jgi:hypothetical protein
VERDKDGNNIMRQFNGPFRPAEFAHVLGVIHHMRYDMDMAYREASYLLTLAERTNTNTLNYRASEFISGINGLMNRLDINIISGDKRTQDMLKRLCNTIRSQNGTTVVQFMRENAIECPQSVLTDLLTAAEETDIPVGMKSARWSDLEMSIDELDTLAFSDRPMTWSWVGSDNMHSHHQ